MALRQELGVRALSAGLSFLWVPPVGTETHLQVAGGVAGQNSEGIWEVGDHREVGLSLRGGLMLGGRALVWFRPSGEPGYQLMGADLPKQLVVSGGIPWFCTGSPWPCIWD